MSGRSKARRRRYWLSWERYLAKTTYTRAGSIMPGSAAVLKIWRQQEAAGTLWEQRH